MPLKKEIIYPVFLECCNYTTDTFWENIFEDLAYGKTPYGTYISKDFLCCSYKKKDFTYKIEKKDPKIIYNELYLLLNEKLGLLSNQEKIKRKKIFIEFEKNIKESRKNWNSIRKKNMKDLLIELYVARMKNKYSLSILQSRKLLSNIFIGLIFKTITSKDIVYKDGKILKINGINFKNKKIIFEKNIYKNDINFSPEIVLEKKLMLDTWEKYIKDLQKNVIK